MTHVVPFASQPKTSDTTEGSDHLTRPLGIPVQFKHPPDCQTGKCTRLGCDAPSEPRQAFCAADYMLIVLRMKPEDIQAQLDAPQEGSA